MGLHDGARFLQEQLDSYVAQDHRAWSLLVSDDGSRDHGPDLIRAFAAAQPEHRITLRSGPCLGFARNFLTLLQSVPDDIPYVALSDQDDVWFPDKLSRAVEALAAQPEDRPALYCAATLVCTEDLAPIGPSPAFGRAPDFRNALVQSIGGGNTMVLNRAALDLAAAAAAEAGDPVAHDWWLYQLVSGAGGRILRDERPVLHYRQHAQNLIGANLSAWASLSRIAALLGGRFRAWNDTGLAALQASAHRLTPEAQQILSQFQAARSGPLWHRLRALRASGVYRQSRLGQMALYIACILRRL
jgi:glycosyltransferase involved in cell wall biosynthesis